MDSRDRREDRRRFRYHQYCPVARACEILTDRWTLLIVRELLFGSRRFNDLRRGLPRISRSLLVARLRHLEANGVIERYMGARPNVTEYVLTEAGSDLAEAIKHLGTWAIKWVFNDPNRDELDPALFLWKMHQRVDHRELPRRRTVVLVPDPTACPGRVAPDLVCFCAATDAVSRQRATFPPPERRSVFT